MSDRDVVTFSRPLDREGRMQRSMLMTALLALDALFLLGNVMHLASNDPDEPTTRFSPYQWNGDSDGSYVEMFGHTQLFIGAVMLAFLAVLNRSYSYAA